MLRSRAAVVVLAGGSGSRVGAEVNKVYLPLAGRRVIGWSLHWATRVPEIGRAVLVVRPEDADLADEVLHREAPGLDACVVVGGATRHASEDAGLAQLAPAVERGEIDVIAVHDGARPLAGPSLFASAIRAAHAVGGAVPVLPADGALPVASEDGHEAALTPPPSPHRLARVQTPQAFRADGLLRAYAGAHAAGYEGTDTASSVEAYGDVTVQAVAGSRQNIKVTYPHDLVLAERLLAAHGYRLP